MIIRPWYDGLLGQPYVHISDSMIPSAYPHMFPHLSRRRPSRSHLEHAVPSFGLCRCLIGSWVGFWFAADWFGAVRCRSESW